MLHQADNVRLLIGLAIAMTTAIVDMRNTKLINIEPFFVDGEHHALKEIFNYAWIRIWLWSRVLELNSVKCVKNNNKDKLGIIWVGYIERKFISKKKFGWVN